MNWCSVFLAALSIAYLNETQPLCCDRSKAVSPDSIALQRVNGVEQGRSIYSNDLKNWGNDSFGMQEMAGYWNDLAVYSSSCHWLVAISALGDSLEMEDGSVWKIDSFDNWKVFDWSTADLLFLTQNMEWFGSCNYRLINKNVGSSVAVNLFQGPILNYKYSRRVSVLEPQCGELILSDHSRWHVSPRDLYLLQEWVVNDSVIIGMNSGWDSSYDAILINVQMNHFVRAKQYE